MRRLTGLFTLLVLLLAMGSVQAQPLPFEFWVYDITSGRIIFVDRSGNETRNIPLPAVMGEQFSETTEFNPTGTLVAYSTYGPAGTRLRIYDIDAEQELVNYLITADDTQYVATSLDFEVSKMLWSLDSSQFAIGIQVEQTWTVIVFDIATRQPVVSINNTHPDALRANIDGLPIIRQLTPEAVYFTTIYTRTEGLPEYPNYVFDFATGTITASDRYPSLEGDIYLPRSEVIYPAIDASYPNNAQLIQGPGNHQNVLKVQYPAVPDAFVFYNDVNYSLARTRFIQNGQRIAVLSVPVDPTSPLQWRVVGRDGVLAGTLPMEDLFVSSLVDSGDGLIYTAYIGDVSRMIPALDSTADTVVAIHIRTDNNAFGSDAGQVVWESGPGIRARIAWIRHFYPVPETQPRWAQIDPSVAGIVPTADASSAAPLFVGGSALINTTEGDRANMRSGPGTGFDVVARLEDGTAVTLLEGPQNDGSYLWWRIQAETGDIGWVVQEASGVQVLVPAPISAVTPPPPANTIFVGGRVMITESGDNLNARQQATTSASVARILTAGSQYAVIGGPIASDGFIWWELNIEGTRAWVAEGDGVNNWLVPVANVP